MNIEEAVTAVNTALSLPKPSSATMAILSSARARVTELSADLQKCALAGGGGSACHRRTICWECSPHTLEGISRRCNSPQSVLFAPPFTRAPASVGHPRSASSSGADAASAKLAAKKPQIAFWLTAAAVSAFVEGEGGGLLPVLGALPDMTSDTATYVSR